MSIFENLKLTTSTFYFNTNRFSLAESGLGSVLFNALNLPANLLPTDQAPTTGVGIEVINPLDQVENTHNRTWVNKISGNYALNYKFLDYFSAQSGIQFNHAMENTEFYSQLVCNQIAYIIQNKKPLHLSSGFFIRKFVSRKLIIILKKYQLL